jgi:2-oxo-3-hexenedioate decarboxylase
LPSALRVKYGVPARDILVELGRRGMVGGQEDMIEDTAMTMAKERGLPKVEPEIVFVLKHALKGPGCHIGSVLAATDFVMAGLEVIDSRYRDFKFDLKSVIADNTSAARFVVGSRIRPIDAVDLRSMGIVMERNGEIVSLGAGAAVLGHPATAVAMLANHLGARGQEIPAGALILSGGITEAVAVARGDSINLRVQGLGSVGCKFV